MPEDTDPKCDKQDYDRAFSFAKEALSFIGTFRTPPTPEVFEVWYRYAEGENDTINEQLSYAVKVAKSVTAQQLRDLRLQFLDSGHATEAHAKISQQIVSEIKGLQSLIVSQEDANEKFGGSIELVNARIVSDSVTPLELKECVNSLRQANESIQRDVSEMGSKLETSKHQMEGFQKTIAELQKELQTDPLTGVGNRKLFDQMIATANEPRTDDSGFYLILIDLDKFKNINDTHGHSTGDDVLRFVASSLRKQAGDAIITRYGGDEFALFASLEPNKAVLFCEDLCQFFKANDLTVRRSGEPLGSLTISVGAAILRPEDDPKSWFDRADTLLYNAKSTGRNRSMVERRRSSEPLN